VLKNLLLKKDLMLEKISAEKNNLELKKLFSAEKCHSLVN
jgi:hypothetical protein